MFADGSSVKREFQALFCEKPEVQSLRLTLPKLDQPARLGGGEGF